jgi:hypothetical protein
LRFVDGSSSIVLMGSAGLESLSDRRPALF